VSEVENLRRELTKAEEVLVLCETYFAHQAHMNATAHMSGKVIHTPLQGAIAGTLHSIKTHREAYPAPATGPVGEP
jgi:hypothetical protein